MHVYVYTYIHNIHLIHTCLIQFRMFSAILKHVQKCVDPRPNMTDAYRLAHSHAHVMHRHIPVYVHEAVRAQLVRVILDESHLMYI